MNEQRTKDKTKLGKTLLVYYCSIIASKMGVLAFQFGRLEFAVGEILWVRGSLLLSFRWEVLSLVRLHTHLRSNASPLLATIFSKITYANPCRACDFVHLGKG
jgi:hypothetical protein